MFDHITKSFDIILSPLLGTINNPHTKNSRGLPKKMNNLNMENKSQFSLDIKYTNNLINKWINSWKIHFKKITFTCKANNENLYIIHEILLFSYVYLYIYII